MHSLQPRVLGRFLFLLGWAGLVACNPSGPSEVQCIEGSTQPECLSGTWQDGGTSSQPEPDGGTSPQPDSGTPVDAGLDDHGNTSAEATPFNPSAGPLQGTFEYPEDIDVLSVPFQEGHYYRSACESQDTGCYVYVLNASGERVFQHLAARDNLFKAPATGTHFIQLSGTTGPWRHGLVDLGLDDHGDTRQKASPVPTSGLAHGTLEVPIDTDVFSFSATHVGHVYRFCCDAVEGVGFSLTLRDNTDSGPNVDSTLENPNTFASVTMELTAPGAYHVTVNAHSSPGQPVPYTCRVENLGPELGDTRADATPLPASFPVELPASLETRQDVDVFSFTATAGHIYSARCEAGTVRACRLRLLDASGALVEGTDSFAWTRQLTSGGTYFLEVRPDSLYDKGTYTLRLADLGPDDHGNTPGTATPVTLGSSITGWNHPEDVDAFSFPATAESIYRVTCYPKNPAVTYCPMELHSPSEKTLRMSYANPSRFDIDAGATETLTLLVNGLHEGYTLKFEELGRDDHGDTNATATPLVLGTSVAGNIETVFDEDIFSISLTAGRTYQALPLDSNSFLTVVRGADGTALTKGSQGQFTPGEDGTYFVEIRPNVSPWNYPTGGYTVQVRLHDGTVPTQPR